MGDWTHDMSSTDMSHAFHLVAKDCRADSEFWFPELHEDTPRALATHYALGLAGEVGELVNMIKKANRRSAKAESKYLMFEDDLESVMGEVADVFIYLVDLAHEIGINVWDAFEHKHHDLEERWGSRASESSGT